jgi:hypothetical protein
VLPILFGEATNGEMTQLASFTGGIVASPCRALILIDGIRLQGTWAPPRLLRGQGIQSWKLLD